jgi:molecular chaperone GrpE
MTDSNDFTNGSPRGDAPADSAQADLRATAGTSPAGADASGSDAAALSSREDWQRQVEEQRDKYLRLAAEYDNFRKRAVRERQEAGWRAQGDLVQGLLETIDDIMRFAHVDPAATDAATLVEGVAMVEKKLVKSLSGHGLEVLNPIDQPFDPAHHEAVATEPALSREDDHLIARVYQPGYLFRGQLLRPARVVVRQWQD